MRSQKASYNRTGGGPYESHELNSVEQQIYNILYGASGPLPNAKIHEYGVPPNRSTETTPTRSIFESPQSFHTASSRLTTPQFHTPSTSTPATTGSSSIMTTPLSSRNGPANRTNVVRNLNADFASAPNEPIPTRAPVAGSVNVRVGPALPTAIDLRQYIQRNDERFDRILNYLGIIAEQTIRIGDALSAASQKYVVDSNQN